MATDRKADYVGDHGGTYTDLNGKIGRASCRERV